ncbi:hypothetical protein KUL25_05090 [Rhodobacteraceae bacterium N5(2021)]|uniref:Uncharacterized protein n=1 Tax=Gymnodinialimonas phycosphaerae TaxID=2841589 RepID=A0A975TWD0_9RHOB|nr:hypothetical protein [Gymnodinialimonas phycosphaerae]MBY4892136.1 hypothetical protein [Gymnodinialimonas phycosphaerae]
MSLIEASAPLLAARQPLIAAAIDGLSARRDHSCIMQNPSLWARPRHLMHDKKKGRGSLPCPFEMLKA